MQGALLASPTASVRLPQARYRAARRGRPPRLAGAAEEQLPAAPLALAVAREAEGGRAARLPPRRPPPGAGGRRRGGCHRSGGLPGLPRGEPGPDPVSRPQGLPRPAQLRQRLRRGASRGPAHGPVEAPTRRRGAPGRAGLFDRQGRVHLGPPPGGQRVPHQARGQEGDAGRARRDPRGVSREPFREQDLLVRQLRQPRVEPPDLAFALARVAAPPPGKL
mmetsp:Transcript_49590/g.146531  ORF Transcript_49590/g.146531 Transcript_49590/m.146531 type:complete len:220 (+) Transcript_49590:489-1148(+)